MEELKTIFKSHGLTVHMHKRRGKQTEYVYAAWREGEKVKQKYFAPLSRIERMTQEEVAEKIGLLKTN